MHVVVRHSIDYLVESLVYVLHVNIKDHASCNL